MIYENNPCSIHSIGRAVPHAGKYKKVPVRVMFNDSRVSTTLAVVDTVVIAKSAAEAANFIQDLLACIPETEIRAWGPKGGEVNRYVGWESAIGASLLGEPNSTEYIKDVLGVQ